MFKEDGRWSLGHLRNDLVGAFMDADRIMAQEYLYNAGNGVDVMVVTEADQMRGKMEPVKRTAAIKAEIKRRLEQAEASKAVVVDLDAIEREKPLWDKYKARTDALKPKSKPEDETVAVIESDKPDKAPEPSKAFLAWLKK